MRNVNFQLVLKQGIVPEYYVFKKLKELFQNRSEFGDLDKDAARAAIQIKLLTNYDGVSRFLLMFTVDFSFVEGLSLDYMQKLILAFGNSFRDDPDIVEDVFRFEDSFMIDEIIDFHLEIYSIEMQIREVINYILAYNFPNRDLFNCIDEFDGVDFGNRKMKEDSEFRRRVFNEFLEGELFHIIFTRYNQFKTPRPLKSDKMLEYVRNSTDFDELKNFLTGERGITENVNPFHKTFVGELSSHLQQIEDVRNEVMHNREVKESPNFTRLTQKTDYLNAKAKVEELISNFWIQEESREIDDRLKVDFALQTLVDSLDFESGDSILFTDFDFEELEAEDKEDLVAQFAGIINDRLVIADQEDLLVKIRTQLDPLPGLNVSEMDSNFLESIPDDSKRI